MSSLGPEASWGQSRRQGMNRLPYLVGENACSHWSQQTRGLRCSVPGWVTRCVIPCSRRDSSEREEGKGKMLPKDDAPPSFMVAGAPTGHGYLSADATRLSTPLPPKTTPHLANNLLSPKTTSRYRLRSPTHEGGQNNSCSASHNYPTSPATLSVITFQLTSS